MITESLAREGVLSEKIKLRKVEQDLLLRWNHAKEVLFKDLGNLILPEIIDDFREIKSDAKRIQGFIVKLFYEEALSRREFHERAESVRHHIEYLYEHLSRRQPSVEWLSLLKRDIELMIADAEQELKDNSLEVVGLENLGELARGYEVRVVFGERKVVIGEYHGVDIHDHIAAKAGIPDFIKGTFIQPISGALAEMLSISITKNTKIPLERWREVVRKTKEVIEQSPQGAYVDGFAISKPFESLGKFNCKYKISASEKKKPSDAEAQSSNPKEDVVMQRVVRYTDFKKAQRGMDSDRWKNFKFSENKGD